MARWMTWLMLLMLLGVTVNSQHEGADESAKAAGEGEDELDTSPDADTVVLFPDFPDHKVTLGSKIDALIGFTNSGSRKFNVTRVWGSLHSALGYQYLLQNYTVSEPHQIVEADQQSTLHYVIKPGPNTEARDYYLTLNIRYEDEDGSKYQQNVFNSTITFSEVDGVDFRQIFPIAVVVGIIVLIGYLVMGQFTSSKKKRSSAPAAKSYDATPGDLSDFLPTQPQAAGSGQGKKSEKKKGGKKD